MIFFFCKLILLHVPQLPPGTAQHSGSSLPQPNTLQSYGLNGEERTLDASSWGLFTNDVMPRAGGDPAAEPYHKALELGLVWVEVILHLQGEGVG